MSLPVSRAADDINLDEFERRLRAAGAQQSGIEDPLSELARLLESSRFSASASAVATQAGTASVGAETQFAPPVENEEPRPLIDEAGDFVPRESEVDREARPVFEQPVRQPPSIYAAENAADARPRAWKFKVAALAIAGIAMIGAVLALKGRAPGLSKMPPFIAAAQGPTKVQPPSDQTVASPQDTGALLKENSNPASVKVVSSEEQPVDLGARSAPSSSAPATDQTHSSASAAGSALMPTTADTPVVPMAPAPPPALASQFPDPKPVRTVSLRPDGTPIASTAPLAPSSDQDVSNPAPPPAAAASVNTAEPTAKPAPAAESSARGTAQPSTPKIELPTKLPGKSSARVTVPKTDTTAPETTQTPGEPTQLAATAPKPEKSAKKAKSGEAIAEATPAATPVDATAATASGWAVQLAAPRSEAEAKSEMARLTSKYSGDLNGSQIGVHKAVVHGETIYRLRVVGLTKADAAALCARLKGNGAECFIAK